MRLVLRFLEHCWPNRFHSQQSNVTNATAHARNTVGITETSHERHGHFDCLFNRVFSLTIEKTPKPYFYTKPCCVGNSPVTAMGSLTKGQYCGKRFHVVALSRRKIKIFTTFHDTLTHWGRDKMDAISQTTLSNSFSWMEMLEFRLKFHWNLFPRVQLTIFQHWFR